jgi:protein-tyrosine phosphatase
MVDALREFLISASQGGQRNFRSLGGWTTADGRRMAAGRVYRSGHLGSAWEDLRSELDRLGLRTVVTFQTPQEIEILGDPVPAQLRSVRWEHIPIGERWFEGGFSFSAEELSQGEFYVRMVFDHAERWARFLRLLAEPERYSVLYHCTAGRDRTGVATLLLLETLRVPRTVIVEDYLRSNAAFADGGQEARVLEPLFAAIDERGGIDRLLEGFGLARAEVEAVRANLLEPRG